MELMKEFPDKYFDLAIVDPPYGIGADLKNSSGKLQSVKSATISKDYGDQKWDSDIPTQEYFIELKRVSRNQIVWGANYFGLTGGYIYWDKSVSMPTYSDGELAYCSLINSVKRVKSTWHGMMQGDMKYKEIRIHPTQKPVQLYKYLLETYANSTDKILDTHLGSGSIAIACHYFGCDLTASEIDKEYYDAAMKRIELCTRQIKMF